MSNEEKSKSDGSSADYYVLPKGARELQDLISHRDMNAQLGEIFRACYRYGQAAHSDKLRDAKKILFYAHAEVERLKAEEESMKAEALIVDLESDDEADKAILIVGTPEHQNYVYKLFQRVREMTLKNNKYQAIVVEDVAKAMAFYGFSSKTLREDLTKYFPAYRQL